jgi:hypothetical protein
MNTYGPKVTWEQMQEGVRIYYTGDMANQSGFGTITLRRPIDPRWKYKQADIAMDDGREMKAIGVESFQPAPGRRFWLEADWKADQDRKIEEFKAAYYARKEIVG